jgi:hypothetical protein
MADQTREHGTTLPRLAPSHLYHSWIQSGTFTQPIFQFIHQEQACSALIVGMKSPNTRLFALNAVELSSHLPNP